LIRDLLVILSALCTFPYYYYRLKYAKLRALESIERIKALKKGLDRTETIGGIKNDDHAPGDRSKKKMPDMRKEISRKKTL